MKRLALLIAAVCVGVVSPLRAADPATGGSTAKPPAKAAAPKPAAKPATAKPAAAKPAAASAKTPAAAPGVDHPPAPSAAAAAPVVKQGKEGEMDVSITGKNKEKLVVGKLDPPAAFNLEDIQNFPEDRLQPLLNTPVTFNEGRDFSRMMDFKNDQPIHPWLPEIAKTPFLAMKSPALEKSPKEWDFAIIDQGGATVAKQSGKGTPPANLSWNGEDSQRVHAAVDTVYIPQLNSTDKDGYHHTYMGQPIQFSSLAYSENGKAVIELSSKRLFLERKADFSKEGPLLLDKVCDVIREGSNIPFSVQPYASDDALARSRQAALIKYFHDKLFIPENQIVAASTLDPEKRGEIMAIISTTVPGGTAQ